MSKTYKADLTPLVERLEALEDRLGITLGALYAVLEIDNRFDSTTLTVTGEIHSSNGAQLAETLIVQAAIYDKSGRLVATEYTYVIAENFFAFDTITIRFSNLPTTDISKIRIFPKKQ